VANHTENKRIFNNNKDNNKMIVYSKETSFYYLGERLAERIKPKAMLAKDMQKIVNKKVFPVIASHTQFNNVVTLVKPSLSVGVVVSADAGTIIAIAEPDSAIPVAPILTALVVNFSLHP
jgi:hypothetical protein